MGKVLDNRDEILAGLPLTPGCYIFRGEDGGVLYVGKSKCLRKRVASYFGAAKDKKFDAMMRIAHSLTYEETDSDITALILEHQLIKKFRPPFNARMKKDRQDWFIQIDKTAKYPSLIIRDEAGSGANIGSFFNEDVAINILTVIGDFWRLPTCGADFSAKKRSCLRAQIGQCLAPCLGTVSPDTYVNAVNAALEFCCADTTATESVLEKIRAEISAAVENLEFEKAARLNGQLEAVTILARQMRSIPPALEEREYFVKVQSFHEDSFIFVYLKDGLALAWQRFEGIKYFPFTVIAKEDRLSFARAVVEIDANRCFIKPLTD